MLLPTMKDAMNFMPGGTSHTDKDGNFTVSNVAPGEYTVQVQSLAALMSAATAAMAMLNDENKAAAPPAQMLEREYATATVTVAGDDITGLTITGTRGARASGRIVFEGGQKPEALTSLRLMAAPTNTEDFAAAMASFGMSAVKEPGTFEIGGLVGGRIFGFMNPPKGWSIKKITHDGNDITDTGYEFKPGEDVDGFEIVMTTRSQTVTGSVSNDKGPVKEYTVVVFPEDSEKWKLANGRWRASGRPDQQGEFKLSELPPGSYLAVAVDYVADGEWMDPEWLGRVAKNATKFTLDEGATKRLDLKLSGS
jgi:hypothetical protein